MKLRGTLAEDLDQLFKVKDAWRNLIFQNSSQWVYSLPEWSFAWLQSFSGDYDLCTSLAWHDTELVGVLPLLKRRVTIHGLPVVNYEPISGSRADYRAPLVKTGLGKRVLECLLETIPQNRRRLLKWPNLPQDHPSLPWFRQYFQRKGWPWFETVSSCQRCVFPATYQELEISWTKKHRYDIRRQRKRLKKMGKLTLEILEAPDVTESWLTEFFAVYSHKYNSEGKPSLFEDPRIRRFYRELLQQLPLPALHLSGLKFNDKYISYHIGFLNNDWLYWYKPVYRKEYRAYSPGKVHISMLMEHGCSRSWKGFDFLQGNELYKSKWSNDTLDCVTLYVGINGGGLAYKWVFLINKLENYLATRRGCLPRLYGGEARPLGKALF